MNCAEIVGTPRHDGHDESSGGEISSTPAPPSSIPPHIEQKQVDHPRQQGKQNLGILKVDVPEIHLGHEQAGGKPPSHEWKADQQRTKTDLVGDLERGKSR